MVEIDTAIATGKIFERAVLARFSRSSAALALLERRLGW
jgi:hypothetical protein